MLLDRDRIRAVYDALGDEISRTVYKHRLLYSLFGEDKEIVDLFCGLSLDPMLLRSQKVCYYGAGVAGTWLIRHTQWNTFVIDTYKSGTCEGIPIISFEEFLKMPDFREYTVLIAVCREDAKREIQARLEEYGLRYAFGYPGQQYFDLEAMQLQNEYFVDVGALDGETTKYLLTHFPGCHSYVFEPGARSMARTKENLERFGDVVQLYPFGVYDRNGALCFDPAYDEPGTAKLAENGSETVEVRRLDDVLGDKPVTFIKMDIEGSELAALRGAERSIREKRPRLAICVYHKPEDIWEIPELLLRYHPDYRLYLRHYSFTEAETVLYAL